MLRKAHSHNNNVAERDRAAQAALLLHVTWPAPWNDQGGGKKRAVDQSAPDPDAGDSSEDGGSIEGKVRLQPPTVGSMRPQNG